MPGGMCAASEASARDSLEKHAIASGLKFVLQPLATYAGKLLEKSANQKRFKPPRLE